MNYKPSDELIYCFSSLFVAKRVPFQLDINCELSTIIDKYVRVPYFTQAMSAFSMHMMDMKNDLLTLSSQSFPSKYFSVGGVKKLNEGSSLKFFEHLSKSFMDHSEDMFDEIVIYFCELAKCVVLFNNVKEVRIRSIVILFSDVFDVVTSYKPISFDERMCTCEDFSRSGDCFCHITDLQEGNK